MFNVKTVVLALLALVVATAPAWAATKEGDKEISAYISFSNTDATPEGGDTTTISIVTISGQFGYFVSKSLQAGANLLQQFSSIDIGDGASDTGVTFLEGFVKYHFNPDTDTVPYVGALLGTVAVSAGEESGSGTTLGAMAGVKFFMTADLSINAEYSIRTYTVTIADTDFSSTTGTALVGMSYYFR